MNFFRKIISYALGNGLSKLIAVIILPIYTNYLNPDEYGKADLVYYTVSIIVSFVFMECWTALLRFIYDDYTEENRKKVLSNTLILTFMLFIPYVIIQYIVSIFISENFAWISCIYGIIYMLLQIIQMYARAIKKTREFVFSGIINSLVQLIVAYIMVVQLEKGAISVILAPTLGSLIALIYLTIATKCIKDIKFNTVDKSLLKKMYIFSIPLAFNSIAFWAMNNINRYFAAYFIDYEASSYVSIASKLTMIITLAASVYSLAWQEDAFEKANDKNKKNIYSNMFSIYIAIFSTATAFSIIFVKFLFPYIIGEQYNDALNILPPYFIAIYFSGISTFLGQIFSAEKKTSTLLSSTVFGTIANVLVVSLSIKYCGIMAIPIGSLIGYMVCTIMRYINLHKLIEIKIEKKDLIYALGLIVPSIIFFYIQKGFVDFLIYFIILGIITLIFYRKIIVEILLKVFGKEK